MGSFDEEQWEEALQAVQLCSLNMAQRLSQLYIVLRVHYTLARLFKMGMRPDLHCPICLRDHGDHIHLLHLLWRCPKMHRFWTGVVSRINRAFQVMVPMDTKPCLLGIVDDILTGDDQKQAIARALF